MKLSSLSKLATPSPYPPRLSRWKILKKNYQTKKTLKKMTRSPSSLKRSTKCGRKMKVYRKKE